MMAGILSIDKLHVHSAIKLIFFLFLNQKNTVGWNMVFPWSALAPKLPVIRGHN